MLQRQLQAACMERVEMGSVATGMGQQCKLDLAAIDFVLRFFRSECAGSGRGGGRSYDWSGHGKKKTGTLTWRGDSEGRQRLVWTQKKRKPGGGFRIGQDK